MNETATEEVPAAPERERHGVGRIARWVAAMLLCVLAVVAVTGAITAYYAKLELFDTDRFTVKTEAIAEDPQVQARIASLVTAQIEDAIDVEAIARSANSWIGEETAPALVEQLVASAAETMRAYIETEVNEFVASPRFLEVWEAAVAEAHASLISALRGENAGSVVADGNVLSLDLGRVVALVKERLVEADFAYAAEIPEIEAEYVLVESEQVPQLQRDAERLEWAATWLPWIALALLVLAFVIAPRRWAALLVIGALGAAMAGGALIGLAAGRTLFIERAEDASFAPVTWDAFTDGLRSSYLLMLIAGVVAAVAAVIVLFLRRKKNDPVPAE
ncbi:hypothetical protein [Glycomyces harbinensis]|uniref:Integral membrane protein n=1 Tax=Glycomyces harbinensis TaxID=58114 RepID=A0A1G7BY92_9ACTN|nr:hypothetical protein [Glycomyces harbinensis]SDE31540.1 hypothetical protein SAMN05216270_11821 [Glycomyces harbinensis]